MQNEGVGSPLHDGLPEKIEPPPNEKGDRAQVDDHNQQGKGGTKPSGQSGGEHLDDDMGLLHLGISQGKGNKKNTGQRD